MKHLIVPPYLYLLKTEFSAIGLECSVAQLWHGWLRNSGSQSPHLKKPRLRGAAIVENSQKEHSEMPTTQIIHLLASEYTYLRL